MTNNLNVVICGTPGTGKTTLIEKLKANLHGFNHINLSKFAIDKGCIIEYDEQLQSHVIDEDKLLDCLEPEFEAHNRNIIECIHADMLPSDKVQLVFVCTTDNTPLYDRLKARGYNQEKIDNNIQSEIYQIIHEEARESFDKSKIILLPNNELQDLDRNIETIMREIQSRSTN